MIHGSRATHQLIGIVGQGPSRALSCAKAILIGGIDLGYLPAATCHRQSSVVLELGIIANRRNEGGVRYPRYEAAARTGTLPIQQPDAKL